MATLSDGVVQYYVAGAPRSNHSGQVIVYTLNSQRKVTVIDSQRGQQVGTEQKSVQCLWLLRYIDLCGPLFH